MRINIATDSPARYSYRACPKGCSGSAGFLESRKPPSVAMEEEASERLLIASAVMDTEPDNRPTTVFPIQRSRLHTIPTAPDSVP